MGVVFRQSVKTTIIIFTGALLGALLIFLSTYMIPDRQELGFTRNLTNQAVVLSQLLLFGVQGTLAVFIYRYDDDARKRHMLIAICLIVPFVFMAVATAAYLLFNQQIIHLFQPQDIPFMKRYFLWLPLFTLFVMYMVVLESYLVSQTKLAIATFMREVVLRLLGIALIILFGYNYISFDVLVAGTALIYVFPVFLLLAIAWRTKGFGVKFDPGAFTKAEYKEILHFSWFHNLSSVSVTLMGFIDSLMLASMDKKGLSSVAVYTIAVFIMSVLGIPAKAMVPAAYPNLAKAIKDDDMDRARDVFIRSSINILLMSVLMAILVICNLNNVISVLPKGYEPVAVLVLIMLIGKMADMATGMNDQIITVSRHYKMNFYMSVLLVVLMVVFNMLLIPRYGYYGAAWATTVAVTLYNGGKFVFVYAKMKIQPFTRSSFSVFLCGAVAFTAGYLFPYFFNPARHVYVHTFLDAAMRSTVIVIVYVLMLLWLKPSPDLVDYIGQVKKNKRLF